MNAGKGDKLRPMNKKQYDSNWDEISKAIEPVATEIKRLKNGKTRYIYTKKGLTNDEEFFRIHNIKLEDQGSQSTKNETLSAI